MVIQGTVEVPDMEAEEDLLDRAEMITAAVVAGGGLAFRLQAEARTADRRAMIRTARQAAMEVRRAKAMTRMARRVAMEARRAMTPMARQAGAMIRTARLAATEARRAATEARRAMTRMVHLSQEDKASTTAMEEVSLARLKVSWIPTRLSCVADR